NPAHWRTQRGPVPNPPLPNHAPITSGIYRHTNIPTYRAFGNMDTAFEQLVLTKSQEMLIILPHGAGFALNAHADTVAATLETFFCSIAFQENGGHPYNVRVHPPRPWKTSNTPFGQPHPFSLHHNPDALPLRRYLLWKQVFAVSPVVSFTALPVVNNMHSWRTLVITGVTIEHHHTHNFVLTQKAQLVARLQELAREDPAFCRVAVRIGNTNNPGVEDPMVHINAVLDTFDLLRTVAESPDRRPAAAYVLMVEPPEITPNNSVNEMCEVFRHPRYKNFSINFDVFRTDWDDLHCRLCKSEYHRTHDCPLPRTVGWLGTTPAHL
ncbi:uncharacterized protein BXZ73DRAFT_29323, partial [Epithele typhae]|uniref:uncharacterized protein n=1 Tax=Epithele typhae TaxID=378194 RepID=UPI00200866E0